MLWTAIGDALTQAAGIAISPIPIALVVLVLVSARTRTDSLSFAAGWLVGVFAATAAAFAISDGVDVDTDLTAEDGGSLIQVLLGLLFVVLAVREWRRRPRQGVESKPPKVLAAVGSMSPPKLFGLGLAAAVANPANLPLAISGGLTIAQAGVVGGEGLIAVAVFTILACSSVLIPVAASMFLGERMRAPLDAVKTWLLANNSTILIILFAVLATKMIGEGLALFS